jgi:hypothetical protein
MVQDTLWIAYLRGTLVYRATIDGEYMINLQQERQGLADQRPRRGPRRQLPVVAPPVGHRVGGRLLSSTMS